MHLRLRILTGTEIEPFKDRDVDTISGGELQRFAVAVTCIQKADVYVLMVHISVIKC